MAADYNALWMARKRWPRCSIEGTGNIAVVFNCCYRVVYCEIPIAAQALAANKCCEQCSHDIAPHGGWHEIVMLDEPIKTAPRLRGNFAAFMAAE